MALVKVTESAKNINSLYIGVMVASELNLKSREKYFIKTDKMEIDSWRGTLTAAYNLGGLSPLYKNYDLKDGDEIELKNEDGIIVLLPKTETKISTTASSSTVARDFVFDKKNLRHLHIEAYSPGNLGYWAPRTEGDIYMLFGAISEYTSYRYCCGTNKALLDALNYNADAKPDAIVIDRNSNEYLIAEMKMKSSAFASNHGNDDIDVLICWEDDAKDKQKLPRKLVILKDVIEKAIDAHEIELS